jgi:hypothetical protein
MPVVPRIEIPPTIPSRRLVVFLAMRSPSGTPTTTLAPARIGSMTSETALVIWARGTGLIAGRPTSRPSPSLVTIPTPSPPSMRMPGSGSGKTRAVRWAPCVTSGSSPASLTTTASAHPDPSSQRSTGKRTRLPPLGRPISTSRGPAPETRAEAAALAAAAEHVPVVHPLRRPSGAP